MLSDEELIQSFIQNSIQRKDVLLANRSLRAQQVYNQNQLLKKTGGIILSVKLNETPMQFLVRPNTPYWETVNHIMAAHHFVSIGAPDGQGFHAYQYCKLPPGYELHCTTANHLWRAWWQYRRRLGGSAIPLELLIRARSTWYPVRDMVCGHGFLYVKTLGTEIDVTLDDLIFWLKKAPQAEPQS